MGVHSMSLVALLDELARSTRPPWVEEPMASVQALGSGEVLYSKKMLLVSGQVQWVEKGQPLECCLAHERTGPRRGGHWLQTEQFQRRAEMEHERDQQDAELQRVHRQNSSGWGRSADRGQSEASLRRCRGWYPSVRLEHHRRRHRRRWRSSTERTQHAHWQSDRLAWNHRSRAACHSPDQPSASLDAPGRQRCPRCGARKGLPRSWRPLFTCQSRSFRLCERGSLLFHAFSLTAILSPAATPLSIAA